MGHLTPRGSPNSLNFVLNIIELISNFIRFLTLSLRLSINITTGHVFFTLLSIFISSLFFDTRIFFLLLLCALGRGYAMFELVIGGIQAFVFSLLCSQYLDEHRAD
jgi:F-type H+-transporting ATPase subunit a